MLATAMPVAGPAPGPATPPPFSSLWAPSALWDDEIRAVCPDPGARNSNLCANGDPVEFAFVWPAGDMRLSCDPAPGGTAADRLGAALTLCPELSAAQRAEIARLVPGAAGGRYGAWVGSRLRAGRICRKLYVEIAEGTPWRDWWPLACLAGPAAPTGLARPVMAGFDAASDGVEVYCRTPRLHPVALASLLAMLGLPDAAGLLTGELARVTGRAVRDALPGRDQGISLAFGPDRRARALTWYSHADMLFGPADRARAAWLQAGAGRGWPMAEYAAISAPTADGVPWHGLAGVTIGADGAVSASITCGLRPGDPS